MKKFSTLLLAALSIAVTAEGQQLSRLIGVHRLNSDGNSPAQLIPKDSTTVIYNSNARGMDHNGYIHLHTFLKADTMDYLGFDPGTGTMGRMYTFALKYNANNLVSERIWLYPTAAPLNSPLVNSRRSTYTYDANNNLIKEVEGKWNMTTSAWENFQQDLYVFNNGNLEKRTRQSWVNSTWVNYTQAEYTYSNGLNTEYEYTLWNTTNSQVTSKNKVVYTYNAGGHMTMLVNQQYDLVNMVYEDKSREVHTLNGANNIMHTITELWDNGTSTWKNYNQLMYSYDANGRDYRDTFETWDDVNSVWKPGLAYQYLYDANGNNIDYTMKRWNTDSSKYINSEQLLYDYNSFNQQTRYRTLTWDKTNNTWGIGSNDYDTKYYYGLYTADVNNITSLPAEVKLYPVPANNILNLAVQWKNAADFTVSITDIYGRTVKSWSENATPNYNRQIPVSDMPAGNYLISISNGNQTATKQFSVIH